MAVTKRGSDHARTVMIASGAKARVGQQEGLVPVEGVQHALGRDPDRVSGEHYVATMRQRGGVYWVGFKGFATHYDGVVVGEFCETTHVGLETRPWQSVANAYYSVDAGVGDDEGDDWLLHAR